MFLCGSIFIMYTAVLQMMYIGPESLDYGMITWTTLGIAFCVDG